MSKSEGDKSFMAMLNNPTINPGPPTKTVSEEIANTGLRPCVFPAVEEAKELLSNATKDVYLSSESDEAFEWINTSTEHDHLPTTEKELAQLGLIDEEIIGGEFKIKSVQEFLGDDDEYKNIVTAFQQIQKEQQKHEENSKGDDSKVYLLGEESVTVLILCIVQDKQSSKKAIVGLKSLLVQT